MNDAVPEQEKHRPAPGLCESMIDRVSDALVALDASWHYVFVNQRAVELLGREKPEDLLGRHIWTEFPEGVGQPFQRAYELAMETQEPQVLVEYYEPWDRWFENRIYPSPDGISIYFHDISETKRDMLALERTQALNELLMDNMVDVVWIMDVASGSFTFVSPSVERLRGYTPEEVLAQPVAAALTPESAEALAQLLPQLAVEVAAGRPVEATGPHRVDQPCKDGSIVNTEVVTRIRVNDLGAPEVIGVSRDITERVQAEQELARYREGLEQLVDERTAQLQEANRDLEEASRIKSEFLARMSHELRTPLNSIIGFADVILLGMTGEIADEQRKQLGMIHRSGHDLLALINDILDLSKVEAGRIEVHAAPLDVRDLVAEVREALTPESNTRGVPLVLDMPAGPVTMITDNRMLKQVLLNLVGNAIKFTDDGSVTLHIRSAEGTVTFTTIDTGCGIAEEDLPRVFDEFWQTRGPRNPNHSGTGLGLAISQRMAGLLGGTLDAASTLGEGSTFTLVVPRVYPGDGAEG
jgi:PAS domain S-box-containing protein